MRRRLWRLAATILLSIADVFCRLGIACEWKAEDCEDRL